ncbi:MAG: CoA-acylating methylmalonate-semialdehyde dehydrogenase [Phenylobacterium sp.]|uniref:CoA-acylating methylmalonate-semialdehyde dehydrogenase n=1 Tax=Phenylobacterium sp. TaxID=1871053 RepID=UPI0027200B72|nr:CoA-acylating methylmalonate-semialdehyde dehydrogenase [Phenylobacterium sp.]MDO8911254.1 CoA-acylating methylmalonate-semialdehyde dehydrogenase [Phenylobacterium sp.]MDP3099189.1 CoA-acylating methylmalonate-semialdehyde dehydrogenase [Phenylobacterium sp.]MDP3632926.1 CoA-acylating methylmalonate-semialdehyde dehydrogenase [Phenylobacterium sp.]
MREITHFIDGVSVAGTSGRHGEVFNPNTGEVQARVALASPAELDAAVQAALRAQPAWAAVNPQRRARVMFEFKRLVEARMQELAELLSSEHGKVVADSKGDIQRGLEVIEFACGIPHALKGEYTEGAGPGIDVYSMRQPLGVAAGITPFNFPGMIPMWMFGIAIAVGNTFILKPSEKDPTLPVRLAELFMEAGAALGMDLKGVLNVVHGDKVSVDAILTHPDIAAVSFVGSSDIASYVYSTGTAHGKRVQAMGGAKNHGIILPDADLDQAVKDIIGAAYGSAGERCMALPVVVPVGAKTAQAVREKVLAEMETLKVGISSDPSAQYGPVVTAAHRQRVADYIQMGVDEGAELVADGRGFSLQGYEQGFFIGPTLFDQVKPTMRTYQEEIFGPVLQIVRAETFEEAVELPSRHQYGNGAAIFTRNGRAAREFAASVNVGMVGINVPIPVPVAYHTFGGWKRSAFGDANQHGMEGVKFYTKVKTVTARWPEGASEDSAFVIPTMR